MSGLNNFEIKVLEAYCRALVHMRSEIEDGRFGLILGAGVSKPLGFPSWSELVISLAGHKSVKGKHILESSGRKLPDTSKTQMLFHHYRTTAIDESAEPISGKLERRIQGQWRRIIHEILYRNAPDQPQELNDKHPYLKHFIPVIAKSSMTVNYNFDDTIQQLLLQIKPENSTASGRSFETVWNAYLPFRSGSIILYHPNGFLPRNLLEYPSEEIVFSEDSFADKLIESMSGHHASLLHHFSKNTCLFLGLSLEDATLRHLLRQSAVINPGHYHYYVQFLRDGASRNSATEYAIREANFEVYNLVTLFMGNDEIAALGRLLTMDEPRFRREADEIGAKTKYFYYLTGAVGTGKTTCLAYLGSFKTYEEWTEERPSDLGKSWRNLEDEERKRLDKWIVRQFYLKNCSLLDRLIGIHVIDRSPLDPISFTETDNMREKAKLLSEGLSPGSSSRKPQNGQVIILTGDPHDLEARVVGRHKKSEASLIDDMQSKIHRIFDSDESVKVLDTRGISIHDVVKRVARFILLEEYAPTDLDELLIHIQTDGLPVAAES